MASPRSSGVPYLIAFTALVVLIATLCGPKLAAVARLLIVLYLPFALALSIYNLAIKRTTWQPGSAATLSDTERYSRAVSRSSAVYLVINFIILIGAKILGVSYDSVWYNYISLFCTSVITYVYDRAVATDDGLTHLKQEPGKTIWNAYLSICSPSFMRYLIVLVIEISLMIIIAYYIGQLIPSQCTLANSVFRKSIVPVFVFSIVGGPLRFAWAYPTVTEAYRIPYLLAYAIAFVILAVVTYASATLEPSSTAGVLIFVGLIAMILQLGGLSNAAHDPDVYADASVMPTWAMAILATTILICILVMAYRVFKDYLQPFLLLTKCDTLRALKHKRYSHLKHCRACL